LGTVSLLERVNVVTGFIVSSRSRSTFVKMIVRCEAWAREGEASG
jgi:hypothetical protein